MESPDSELRVKRYGGLKLRDLSVIFSANRPLEEKLNAYFPKYAVDQGKRLAAGRLHLNDMATTGSKGRGGAGL